MGEADLAGTIGRPPAPHPAIRLIKVRREGFGGFRKVCEELWLHAALFLLQHSSLLLHSEPRSVK